MWFGDLVDITEFIDENSEQDIYIKLPPSELDMYYTVTLVYILRGHHSFVGCMV